MVSWSYYLLKWEGSDSIHVNYFFFPFENENVSKTIPFSPSPPFYMLGDYSTKVFFSPPSPLSFGLIKIHLFLKDWFKYYPLPETYANISSHIYNPILAI